jgi:hypothetical protein
MATETDPLAVLAAEAMVRTRLDDAEKRELLGVDEDGEWWGFDAPGVVQALLLDLTATWELDGSGLRRLVLTCPWETDPTADTR